jgi:hypothetical protein
MRQPHRASAFLVFAPLAAAALTSCASPGAGAERHERPGIVLGSSSFFSRALEGPESRPESSPRDTGARSATANPALCPDDPWLGTIGVGTGLPGAYEYGVGLCVPNPFGSRVEPSVATDRTRTLGLGAWLKFDF